MLTMKNGFEIRDDMNYQCLKQTGDKKYLLIEMIWLDNIVLDDTFIVVAEEIDVNEMTQDMINDAICGYYNSVEQMEESYGLSLDQLSDIVAECEFESNNYCSWDYVSEEVAFERAKEIIQKFIDTDGKTFLTK